MDTKTKKAIEVLKNGGIVIFPTDTAIGIGCRMDDKKAVKRLLKIRKRPENKALLILVDSIKMAEKYLLPIPKKVKNDLINHYWPGKLTIVLQSRSDKVPNLVRDTRDTLAVRFPNDSLLLKLIKGVGVPIVAPSANFSGEKTPFEFEDLNPELVKMVDYVLNKKVSKKGKVSTIIDCSVEPWQILRQGSVSLSI